MVSVTLRFDYPWMGEENDENEIMDALMELSPEELLVDSMKAGKIVNVDIEVY